MLLQDTKIYLDTDARLLYNYMEENKMQKNDDKTTLAAIEALQKEIKRLTKEVEELKKALPNLKKSNIDPASSFVKGDVNSNNNNCDCHRGLCDCIYRW